MKAFVMLVLLALSFIASPSSVSITASARQGVVYDLGVETYSTTGRPGFTRFYAAGNIYPAGTYTPNTGQPLPRGVCDRADDVQRVGYFVIYGESGGAGKHNAIYRVVIGEKTLYFSGLIEAIDESGSPISSLFELATLSNGVFRVSEPPVFAEFTPRSNVCFGGQLKLFLSP
jgi:hypothetical protein